MGGGVLIAAIAIFPFTDNDAVLGYDCTDRHFSSRRCGPGKVKRTAHGQRQWKGVHGPLIAKPRKGSNGAKAIYIARSEEHTSELQSLMRISYAVFCLKKKKEHT